MSLGMFFLSVICLAYISLYPFPSGFVSGIFCQPDVFISMQSDVSILFFMAPEFPILWKGLLRATVDAMVTTPFI